MVFYFEMQIYGIALFCELENGIILNKKKTSQDKDV
jgi:hypothetical protein